MKINNTNNAKEIKTSIEAINQKSLDIDANKIADEILDWLIANVEQFIDNQSRTFKIDLIIDGESNPPMPETRRLQNLFRQIPEDEKMVDASKIFKSDGSIDMKGFNTKGVIQATKIRNSLNEISQTAFNIMQDRPEKIKKLFERMGFFYELIGINKGNLLLKEISGAVKITKFEYEAFSMDVQVKSPTFKIQGEDGIKTIESESKKYNIPEGFTVWVEIAFRPKVATTALF